MTTPDATLAEFVAGLRHEDVPEAAARRASLLVLDAVACGFAGQLAEGREEMEAVAGRLFGPGPATVLAGGSAAPAGAALLNGFKIAAPTLGDVHRETLTHVLPEVLPAALVAAELHGAAGTDLLTGLIAGIEVTVRVAQALDTPAYRARAFHNPGIAGAAGAACAAARVQRLEPALVRQAIGHAVSQAAGTFAALGTSGVKVHQARGALSGLLAAELAAGGLDAAADALTAPRGGLLASYADGGNPERLTAGLGSVFALESIALRRWPGASSLQPVIAATLELRAELGLEPGVAGGLAAVEAVHVELPARAFALNGTAAWDSRLSALQSARWTVAVVLEDGEAWLEQTAAQRLADGVVGDFARHGVTVAEDASLPPTSARVAVRDTRGHILERAVDVPPGDPRRPLDAADVREKLERAARAIGLAGRTAAIESALAALGTTPSVAPLAALLRNP